MKLFNKSKTRINEIWEEIKKYIDDARSELAENIGPKLKTVKIKSNESKNR